MKENYNSSAFQFHRSPPPKPEVTAGATLPTDHYSILHKTLTSLLLFGINLIKDSGCARTHTHKCFKYFNILRAFLSFYCFYFSFSRFQPFMMCLFSSINVCKGKWTWNIETWPFGWIYLLRLYISLIDLGEFIFYGCIFH